MPTIPSFIRKFLTLSSICLILVAVPFGLLVAADEINNERIIEMTTLGLGDEIIVARIKIGRCEFSLSDFDLLALKKAGVSDKVVAAMLEASVLTDPIVSVDGKLLDLHTLGQSKSGGRLGAALSFGFKSVKNKAYLNGKNARVFVSRNPNIELELPRGDSIENYIIVKMDRKSDRREIEVGSAGGTVGRKSGIRAESIIRTSSMVLNDGRYQLRPLKPLKRQAYIIYIIGSADFMKGIYGKGYDFSVD